MSFNNGLERKRFESKQKTLREEYNMNTSHKTEHPRRSKLNSRGGAVEQLK